MSISGGIVAFIVIWWLVLFTVLPVGVRTQDEDGEVVPGSMGSAPSSPQLLRKAMITTGIAAVLWTAFFFVVEYEIITLDDFPF